MKPMLAGKANLDTLKFPVLYSPKLDGVRALVIDGTVYSRNMKPIPSQQVQELFGKPKFDGLDGELIVGPPNALDVFTRTTSHVMSKDKPHPQLQFHVFDDFTYPDEPYTERELRVHRRTKRLGVHPVKPVEQYSTTIKEVIEHAEKRWLVEGYEGVMLRSHNGLYKQGRSTEREGYLLKLKRFEHGEAIVLDTVEEMKNENEKVDGKRTSHKAGKTPKGVLGALIVQDVATGQKFNIGTGFTAKEREEIWADGSVKGRVARYKYFPSGGKEAPRFPVFAGWRED